VQLRLGEGTKDVPGHGFSFLRDDTPQELRAASRGYKAIGRACSAQLASQ
jgi:hypothetical protein